MQRNHIRYNANRSTAERRSVMLRVPTRLISRTGFLKGLLVLVLAINIGVVLSIYVYALSAPLETTTLRELAYVRERNIGDGRAVYVTLFEYYHANRLVVTEEAMAYVGPDRFTTSRYGRFANVDILSSGREFGGFDVTGTEFVEFRFGPEAKKQALLLQEEEWQDVDVIVGFMIEDRVVFVPETSLGR